MTGSPGGMFSGIPEAIAAATEALRRGIWDLAVQCGSVVYRFFDQLRALITQCARWVWGIYQTFERTVATLLCDILLTFYALRMLAGFVGVGAVIVLLGIWWLLLLYVLIIILAALKYRRPVAEEKQIAANVMAGYRAKLVPILQWSLRAVLAVAMGYLNIAAFAPALSDSLQLSTVVTPQTTPSAVRLDSDREMAKSGQVPKKTRPASTAARSRPVAKKRVDDATDGGSQSTSTAQVYRVGQGVISPQIIMKIDPSYSEEARQMKVQGTVIISLVVGEDGLPRDLKIVESLGYGLDEKALEAAKKFKFRPGSRNGIPVPVIARVKFDFRLM
ncbi:MAG: TonB family protein [Bryobacteraceae bacterium]|nr:TonB family protein [Bryobacteraceae bacterium]